MNEKSGEPATNSASTGGGSLLARAVLIRLRFVALLLLIALGAALFNPIAYRIERSRDGAVTIPIEGATEFFCPMHPNVLRREPAKCPACGMPLSERAHAEKASGEVRRLSLSPYQVEQAGIQVTAVAWQSLALRIEGSGALRYDETRLQRIGAGFAGRVASIEGSFDGALVRRGRPLLRIVGAEVRAALQAYVKAARELREVEARSATAAIARLKEQTESLRKQLLQWGLDREQLALLEETGEIEESVPVLAPFDCVVLHCEVAVGQQVLVGSPLVHIADTAAVVAVVRVPRADGASVKPGQRARIRDPLAPEVLAKGTVDHVASPVEERTQSIVVRIALTSPDTRLRPGAFVAATIDVPFATIEPWRSMERPAPGPSRTVYECTMHQIVRDVPGECAACGGMKLIPREVPSGPGPQDVLAVPETAVVDTGTHRFVYVETAPGIFEAREVVLGRRAGAFFPVIRGLDAGTRIAVAGSFLLDAETRLDPAAAGTYFGAGAAPRATEPPAKDAK